MPTTLKKSDTLPFPPSTYGICVFLSPFAHFTFHFLLHSYNVTPLLSIQKLFLAHFGPFSCMYSLDIETGYKCTIFNGNTSYTTFSVYSISMCMLN